MKLLEVTLALHFLIASVLAQGTTIATPIMMDSVECTHPIGRFSNLSENILADPHVLGMLSIVGYPCQMQEKLTEMMADKQATFLFPVDSKIKFLCSSLSKAKCSSMDILSRVDIDINKSVEVLNSNQSILTVEFLSPTNANNFYYIGCECKTVENTSRTIGEFRSFKVSYKPPPVSGFQCIVKDFENAVCTWDLQTDYGSEYTVCFGLINDWMRKKIKESYVPPDKTSFRNCSTSVINNTFVLEKRSSLLLDEPYRMEIISRNMYGETTTIFNYTITAVKLSPPKINLPETLSSTEMEFTWKTDCKSISLYKTYCYMHGLLYQLTLTVDEDATPDFENIFKADRVISLNGSYRFDILKPDESKSVISVKSLMPATKYIFSMQQKPNISSSLWSEPKLLLFKTNATEPHRGPFINENGFSFIGTCENGSRRVNIYWKGLGAHNGGNGEIIEYGTLRGSITRASQYREITICVPIEKTEVTIYAANIIGRSSYNSTIALPSSSHILQDVLKSCQLTVRIVKKSRTAVIDWTASNNALRERSSDQPQYTLFWCREQTNTSTCQEELNWLTVDSNHSTTYQTVVLKSNPSYYKFGVAAVQDGLKSGIIWSDCVIHSTSPNKEDVNFTIKEMNDTHSSVSVTPKCRSIANIDVNYCLTGAQLEDNQCKEGYSTKSSVTMRCFKTIAVPMKENRDYLTWLTVSYIDDMNTAMNSTPQRFHMNLLNSNSVNMKLIGQILGPIAAVIGIIIIILTAFYIKKKGRKAKDKYFPATVAPAIKDEFHIEPDNLSVDSNFDAFSQAEHVDIIGYRKAELLTPASFLNSEPTKFYSELLADSTENNRHARQKKEEKEADDETKSKFISQQNADSAYGESSDNGGDMDYQFVTKISCSSNSQLADDLMEDSHSGSSSDLKKEGQQTRGTVHSDDCSFNSDYLKLDCIRESNNNEESTLLSEMKRSSQDSGSFFYNDDGDAYPLTHAAKALVFDTNFSGGTYDDFEPHSGLSTKEIILDEFL